MPPVPPGIFVFVRMIDIFMRLSPARVLVP